VTTKGFGRSLSRSAVVEGPVWTHVRAWDKNYLGHEARLPLESQMEGISAVASRRNVAYAVLLPLKFSFDAVTLRLM